MRHLELESCQPRPRRREGVQIAANSHWSVVDLTVDPRVWGGARSCRFRLWDGLHSVGFSASRGENGSIHNVAFLIEFLLVLIGGSIGAMLRVLLTVSAALYFKVPFWTGIMVVNIVGCLLIGAAAAVLTASNSGDLWLVRTMESMLGGSTGGLHGVELLLLTGVLGGFTTFSTAMLDTWVLWRSGHLTKAMISLFGTPIAAILALSLGLWIGGGR